MSMDKGFDRHELARDKFYCLRSQWFVRSMSTREKYILLFYWKRTERVMEKL